MVLWSLIDCCVGISPILNLSFIKFLLCSHEPKFQQIPQMTSHSYHQKCLKALEQIAILFPECLEATVSFQSWKSGNVMIVHTLGLKTLWRDHIDVTEETFAQGKTKPIKKLSRKKYN